MAVSTRVRFDVVGIGNALVDVIAHAGDRFIRDHDLVKGSMELIDTDRAMELYRALGSAIEMSGGSAANTMTGIASFGGRAGYIGKVSADDLGDVFAHDLRAVGVRFKAGAKDGRAPTGRCIIVVTPDAERTMNTYLGASSLFSEDDLDEGMIAAGKVLYMEGYLFDRPAAKKAFRRAAEVAHEHGRRVSLTLSDSFCVDRHRRDFRSLVSDQVDVLFGNRAELVSLYETESFEQAVEQVRQECQLAVVTTGADGCLVIGREEILSVPAQEVKEVLDTTGAGDMFAAGFLYGLTRGLPLAECGALGALGAAEVISHVGPRPLVELHTLLT